MNKIKEKPLFKDGRYKDFYSKEKMKEINFMFKRIYPDTYKISMGEKLYTVAKIAFLFGWNACEICSHFFPTKEKEKITS